MSIFWRKPPEERRDMHRIFAVTLMWLLLPVSSASSQPPMPLQTLVTECDAGKAASCLSAAAALDKYPSSKRLAFRKACDLDVVEACISAARMYVSKTASIQDLSMGAGLFGQACRKSNMTGCIELGHMYSEGKGVAKAEENAFKLYDRACKAGDSEGCNWRDLSREHLDSQKILAQMQRDTARMEAELDRKKRASNGQGQSAASGAPQNQIASNTSAKISREDASSSCMADLGGEEWVDAPESVYQDMRATCNCRNFHYPKKDTMSKAEFDQAVNICSKEGSGTAFLDKYFPKRKR